MIDPPKRTGYRLTYDAECLYNDWQELGGCSCHTGCAPCRSCHNDGHPISLEENDEAWEIDTVGELVKVRVKPAHFHEVAVCLPIHIKYSASTVFETRDYCDGWLLHGKVFHKKVFDVVEEEEDMARDNITDKSSPPKSEWFNGKYRVTPETSKLLQEAVFKDGGKWVGTGNKFYETDASFIFVDVDGIMGIGTCYGNFQDHKLPEKQPPQVVKVEPQPAKKSFTVGKWYKCVDDGKCFLHNDLTKDKWFKINHISATGGLEVTSDRGKHYDPKRFDINSELDYDPNTAQPAGYTAYVVFKQEVSGAYYGKEYAYKCSFQDYNYFMLNPDRDIFAEVNVSGAEKKVKVLRIEAKVDPKATKSIVRILPKDIDTDVKESTLDGIVQITITCSIDTNNFMNSFLTTKEDIDMSNQRKVVEVQLFDDAKGLPVQDSLVAKFDNVLTEDDNDTTIREVIMNNDIKKVLAAHNVKRSKVINQDILERTGNSVALQPILLKDLRWKVIG